MCGRVGTRPTAARGSRTGVPCTSLSSSHSPAPVRVGRSRCCALVPAVWGQNFGQQRRATEAVRKAALRELTQHAKSRISVTSTLLEKFTMCTHAFQKTMRPTGSVHRRSYRRSVPYVYRDVIDIGGSGVAEQPVCLATGRKQFSVWTMVNTSRTSERHENAPFALGHPDSAASGHSTENGGQNGFSLS